MLHLHQLLNQSQQNQIIQYFLKQELNLNFLLVNHSIVIQEYQTFIIITRLHLCLNLLLVHLEQLEEFILKFIHH